MAISHVQMPVDNSNPLIKFHIENAISDDYLMCDELDEMLPLYEEDGLDIIITTYG